MLAKILLGAAAVALLALGAVAAGLIANRPPLLERPGPWARLSIYLSRNVAATGPEAALPELRPLLLDGDRPRALEAVAGAMRSLGWRAIRVDDQAGTVHAEVVTRWLRFTDDVRVALREAGHGRVEARVRSASRIGRGDLGANARHVMDLRAALGAAGALAGEPR